MDKNAKIYVAGHRGLVGSCLCRTLEKNGYSNLVKRTHQELDLCSQEAVNRFFEQEQPEYVFLSAAKVGGIVANDSTPADFITTNTMIQSNVINACFRYEVKRLMFMGSGCIYPRECPQPIKEEYLLTGPLELTNEAYAVAKIAGLKTCYYLNKQYGTKYISVMPCNLYGENDNFDLETSHVMPALIRKFHEAKVNGNPTVTIWGTGSAMREFMYADDLGDACVFLMNNYFGDEIVNIGYGKDIRIYDLAEIVQKVVGYTGKIVLDSTKPDGTPRKLLDSGRLFDLGWRPSMPLEDGIRRTYDWYQNVYLKGR